MVTPGAKGGSNFLATQINQRNCGHDNYHPMARSSVTAHSLSSLFPLFAHPPHPGSVLITKNSFGLPVPTDAALSMLMMSSKSRAFINNKSDQSRVCTQSTWAREWNARADELCVYEQAKLWNRNVKWCKLQKGNFARIKKVSIIK